MLSFFKTQFKSSYTAKPLLEKVADSLKSSFPIDFSTRLFNLFPFCNEENYIEIIRKLEASPPLHPSKSSAAILFGESNFISLLPELSKHASLIILADIEPTLHLHTMHLLSCLEKSNSIEEFRELYAVNNPVYNEKIEFNDIEDRSTLRYVPWMFDSIVKNLIDYSLDRFHFLESNERFLLCKEASSRVIITNVCVDLFNVVHCFRLKTILEKNDLALSLCNFTNIHEYDSNKSLAVSIPFLLNQSSNCFLMYSKNLRTRLALSRDDYLLNIGYSPDFCYRKLADAFNELYLDYPYIAIQILKDPLVVAHCSGDAILQFGKRHAEVACLVIENPTLARKMDIYGLVCLGESHIEVALKLLKHPIYEQILDSYAILTLCQTHQEAAIYTLQTPILAEKLSIASLEALKESGFSDAIEQSIPAFMSG